MILAKYRSSFSRRYMPAGTTINGILKRDVIFLVDSTLFCAVVPSVITFITIMLTKIRSAGH